MTIVSSHICALDKFSLSLSGLRMVGSIPYKPSSREGTSVKGFHGRLHRSITKGSTHYLDVDNYGHCKTSSMPKTKYGVTRFPSELNKSCIKERITLHITSVLHYTGEHNISIITLNVNQ